MSMYGIICPDCGPVELSEEEYNKQLDSPNSVWTCPICAESAEWDDDSLIASDNGEQDD